MNKTKRAWAYGLFGFLCVVLDRFTKYEALCWCVQPIKLHEYVSCQVLYNRGVSWGLFHDASSLQFFVVTSFVVFVTLVVLWYAIQRFRESHFILGEVMVLAGSLSNLLDRAVYKGVVDFIELSYRGWQWPSFNVADICIVVGVFIMAVEYYRK